MGAPENPRMPDYATGTAPGYAPMLHTGNAGAASSVDEKLDANAAAARAKKIKECIETNKGQG
ncbi:hypothetical protein N9L33_05300 [Nitrospinae bacterium]|jgi:hypothetical protein|nr:hypothetical protein [Nitrospinota bacterium]